MVEFDELQMGLNNLNQPFLALLLASDFTLLLMDERAGRATAMEYGLQVAGTAAVIGMARQRGLIPSARAVFAKLHASDFRISVAVIATVLERFGETKLAP